MWVHDGRVIHYYDTQAINLLKYQGVTHPHNLKVVGSNPAPATKIKARNVNALAGFLVRKFGQFSPQRVISRNTIKIKVLPSCIIGYWRVHVTRSAHDQRCRVRHAFRDHSPPPE
jgi:hypothetical protein